jgi:hypothetical protein
MPLENIYLHNYTQHSAKDLPEFVPNTPAEAAFKLYSANRYLYQQRSLTITEVIAIEDARTILIKLHDQIQAENWQPFKGDLVDSLTETVRRRQ